MNGFLDATAGAVNGPGIEEIKIPPGDAKVMLQNLQAAQTHWVAISLGVGLTLRDDAAPNGKQVARVR